MSTPHADVDDTDRLARVKLSSAIEPGDLRVTGLVGELGAGKVLDYREAAGGVENHWGFALAQELGRVDPAKVLEQAGPRGIRFVIPGDAEWPGQLGALRDAGALHDPGGEPVGLWVGGTHDLRQLAGNAVAVVGSRAATSYGTHQATEMSRDLATMGHTVTRANNSGPVRSRQGQVPSSIAPAQRPELAATSEPACAVEAPVLRTVLSRGRSRASKESPSETRKRSTAVGSPMTARPSPSLIS